MMTSIHGWCVHAALVSVLAFAALIVGSVVAEAKDGNDRDRIRFQGWVQSMPDGLHGIWTIGGRHVVTNARTEFDQSDGPLLVGRCAKVDIRGGLVHEIDSEPAGDCR